MMLDLGNDFEIYVDDDEYGDRVESHCCGAPLTPELAVRLRDALNARYPATRMPHELQVGTTCDWGGCDEDAVAFRYWQERHEDLPVCAKHRGPA